MSYDNAAQTNLVPKTLFGTGSVGGSEVSMSVSPTGIILGGDLNTATPITATISQAGIITDNPTGFNILSSLNLNSNYITDVDTISSTTGSVINISGDGGIAMTSANGSISLNSSTEINLTSAAEINIVNPSDTWFNLTTPNTGDGKIYAGTVLATLLGNASSASTVEIIDNNTSATYYPTFVSNNVGNLTLNVDKTTNPLSYIPSTGNLSSTLFTGLLSTGGLVYLSTGSVAITGSSTFNNFNLPSIFNSTYKNYRIVLAPTTQLTFNAYPSYSLTAFLGTGSMPTVASLYGFEITSASSSLVSPVYTAGATISSSPLILAVSQSINHRTIIEVENVGFSATTSQQIGLKCKSFYGNPGVSGASDRSILVANSSGSTITGLTLQQSSISVGNNMTIGWTIYGYK
jgi:hypothetical protein